MASLWPSCTILTHLIPVTLYLADLENQEARQRSRCCTRSRYFHDQSDHSAKSEFMLCKYCHSTAFLFTMTNRRSDLSLPFSNSNVPQSQVSQFSNMLTQEYGTASNIKSRVNRLSVLAAITSTQQRLKLYNRSESLELVAYIPLSRS